MIRAVVFDVGEWLVDESREYGTWADWLRVPRHTFSAMFGAVIARGLDYRETFQVFAPGFDLAEPDPAFFERVAQAAPCDADGILYVGDRLDNDIRPAVAAGLRTALIRRGPWAMIQQHDPDAATIPTARLDSLAELPGLLSDISARRRTGASDQNNRRSSLSRPRSVS